MFAIALIYLRKNLSKEVNNLYTEAMKGTDCSYNIQKPGWLSKSLQWVKEDRSKSVYHMIHIWNSRKDKYNL